jgi:TonB family protein
LARNSESGVVHVGVFVSATGAGKATRIVKSSGFPELDEETAKHLATCKYTPAIDPWGEPIAAEALVGFEWK